MRKTRNDCTVGSFEKKHGLPPGTIRNKDGRDTRSDKKIGTIRKEYEKEANLNKWLNYNGDCNRKYDNVILGCRLA